MNILNALGGGLLLLAVAYAATIVLFHRFWVPPGGRVALYSMAATSAVTLAMCGLGILTGVAVFGLERGAWAAAFVAGQLLFLWAFDAVLFVELLRRRGGDSKGPEDD